MLTLIQINTRDEWLQVAGDLEESPARSAGRWWCCIICLLLSSRNRIINLFQWTLAELICNIKYCCALWMCNVDWPLVELSYCYQNEKMKLNKQWNWIQLTSHLCIVVVQCPELWRRCYGYKQNSWRLSSVTFMQYCKDRIESWFEIFNIGSERFSKTQPK